MGHTSSLRTFLKGCKDGMRLFGQNIALIVNTLLLIVVYALGVGLTSLIAKMAGKHFLEMELKKDRKKKGGQKSYWQDLNLKKRPMEEYYRQF